MYKPESLNYAVAPLVRGAGSALPRLRGSKFSCNKSLRKQTNQVNNIKP